MQYEAEILHFSNIAHLICRTNNTPQFFRPCDSYYCGILNHLWIVVEIESRYNAHRTNHIIIFITCQISFASLFYLEKYQNEITSMICRFF